MSSESIWTRPSPGQRQPSLSREQIARAATELVDAEGAKALTMRRIAQSLGVGTMTLYHYVHTKDELLELIDDQLMAELVVPDAELPSGDWRAAMTLIAVRTRETHQRHPWLLSARGGMASAGPPGPNALRHFEQSLAAAAATGLRPEDCLDVVALVDDYVFGHSLRNAEPTGDESSRVGMITFIQTQLAGGAFPHLASLFAGDGWQLFETIERDQSRFTRGLVRLLDGIALDLQRRNLP